MRQAHGTAQPPSPRARHSLALISPRRLLPITPRTLRNHIAQQAMMASKDGSRLFEQGDYNADVKLLLAFKQQQAEPLPAGVVGLHAPVEPIAARPSSMPAPTPTPPPHPSPSHPSPRRSEGATPSRGYRDYAPPAVQTVFQPEPSPPQPVDPDSDAARASAAHESRLASARSTAAAWSHATTPLGAGASSARVAVDDHAATPRDVAAGNPRVAADGAPTDAPRGRLRTSPRAALGAAKPNATTTAAGAEPAAASRRQHIQSCREYVHALLASAQAAGEEVPLWKAELATRAANRHEPIRSARRPVQLDHAKLVEMRASLRSEPSSPARGAGGARSQRRASGAAAAAERATADVEALAALRRSSSVESSAEQQRRRLLEWHCDSGSDDDELRAPTRARLRGLRESCDETLDRIEDAELETQSLLEKLGVAREAVERATAAVRETHREDAADDERRKRRDVQTQRAILFEKRVEEARARNRAIKAVVADLRAERRVFTAKTRRADARSAEMDADIKLFARQAAEALDEGERSEFQLRRVEFDVLAEERAHVALLRAEEAREVRLDHDVLVAERAERKAVELERRAGYALLHDIRRHDEAFQTRRDYLRAQVSSLEAEFMRLCRVMDIRYAGYDVTGEVQRVREIVSAYTSNEAANSSLISYLGVQTDRLAELAASAREAEAQIARLQKRDSARQRAIAAYAERRSAELEQPTLAALLALRSRPLELALEPIRSLLALSNVHVADKHLQMQGVRVDTIERLLALLDGGVRQLHARACAIAELRPELDAESVVLVFAESLSKLDMLELSTTSAFERIDHGSQLDRERKFGALLAAALAVGEKPRSSDTLDFSAAQLAAIVESGMYNTDNRGLPRDG